jgi:UDP-N-acetylglucosamine:LPS N-acetylglucosamine transferase
MEHLAGRLAEVLRDEARWRDMTRSARQLARPAAARDIVHDCEDVMAGRW